MVRVQALWIKQIEIMRKLSKVLGNELNQTNSGFWQYETSSTHIKNDFKWSWSFSHNAIEVGKN